MTTPRARRASVPKRLLFSTLATLLFLVLLEGATSLVLALASTPETNRYAERLHTEFDPELGWIHRASCRVPDLYGKGRSLTTNAQRVRATSDLAPALAPGRHRIVCVGDSFTLGYGVDDASTWAAKLASLLPDAETVNMGQGGYGADQAWLWYRRDATFEHDRVLFAVIASDFARMSPRFAFGFPKPWITLRDGKPVVANTPLAPPQPGGSLLDRLRFSLHETAIARALGAITGRLHEGPREPPEPDDALVRAMLDDLRATCERRNAKLAIVLLPTMIDEMSASAGHWEESLARWSRERGVEFLDLLPPMRALPREVAPSLYFHPGAVVFSGAAGHFNEAGNEWVARQLAAALGTATAASSESREGGH